MNTTDCDLILNHLMGTRGEGQANKSIPGRKFAILRELTSDIGFWITIHSFIV